MSPGAISASASAARAACAVASVDACTTSASEAGGSKAAP
jgi:hypothetical protein